MLINKNTKITGNKVILVPYRAHHVPKYHKWMQSEELQRLTSSLPLSLEQEHQMQKLWQTDEDKLTFIVLDREIYEVTADESAAMIGDTNIFLLPSENNVDEIIAEPEIMIAEPSARGKGCGYEAMQIMLQYGIEKLNIKTFIAKILEDNSVSLRLFEKLGFRKKSYSDVFKEQTLEVVVDETFVSKLGETLKHIQIHDYK